MGRLSILMIGCLLLGAVTAHGQSSPSGPRRIGPLGDDLYLAEFDGRATLFLVTSDGIVLVDPLGVEGAQWLRQELGNRFPNRQVRYILLTHHHFDRAAGTTVFGTGPVTIGQREFNVLLEKADPVRYADVRPVQRLFDHTERIELGGRVIEMHAVGTGHSNDLAVIYVPHANVVFAPDRPAIDQGDDGFREFSAFEVSRWLDVVAALDANRLVAGDGQVDDMVGVRAFQPLLQALTRAVKDDVAQGRTLASIAQRTSLPTFRDNPYFGSRLALIRRAHRALSVRRFWFYGAGGVGMTTAAAGYCARFSSCTPFETETADGLVGFAWSTGRVGISSEAAVDGQTVGRRTSTRYDDAVATRTTRVSGLLRVQSTATRGTGVDIVGGVSIMVNDSQGLSRTKEAFLPVGGRHDVRSRDASVGVTGGADFHVPLGPRWELQMPVRLTTVNWSDSEFRPGGTTLRVGVGLAWGATTRTTVRPGPRGVVPRPARRATGEQP